MFFGMGVKGSSCSEGKSIEYQFLIDVNKVLVNSEHSSTMSFSISDPRLE